jgi:hypothetical protein
MFLGALPPVEIQQLMSDWIGTTFLLGFVWELVE